MTEMDPPQEPERQSPSPNPFGYADHSPFGAFGIELVYGLRSDETLLKIEDAPKGLACNCVCPACRRTLVAVKGPQTMAHFRHHGKNSGCGRNAETNAHAWAKEVLERELRILLPGVAARIGKDALTTHKPRMFPFARAELEKTLDDIVPDVILTTKEDQQVLVEVLVTHACGPEKIDKLRARGLATLEVDMSAWRKSSDRTEIEQALIEHAPREWISNRKLDEAEERLRASIAARETREAEAERRRLARAEADRKARETRLRQELEGKVAHIGRALAAANRSRSDAGRSELDSIRSDAQFRTLLRPSQICSGFLVPAERWQAVILDRLVKVPVGEQFVLPHFTLETALRAVSGCIQAPFQRELAPEVWAALPKDLRQQVLPRQAVEYYLRELCSESILQLDSLGGFELADDRAEALEKAHEAWLIHSRRRRAINRAMEKILQAIPAGERAQFSPALWQERRIAGFDRTLDAIVRSEDAIWTRFDRALMAIEAMVEGGDPAPDTLGLPLRGESERAQLRAAQKAETAASDRERQLGDAAWDAVGKRAAEWLRAPGEDGQTPITQARSAATGLAEALGALERYRRAMVAQDTADALATRCRETLKAEAQRKLKAEEVQPFLQYYDRALDASPWHVCADAAGLRMAKGALEAWVARSRRNRRR